VRRLTQIDRISSPPKNFKSLNELPEVRSQQETVDERRRKWEDQKAKLERANLAYQTAFGHLDEGALSEHHRQLREKLELFQDRTVEAKHRYDKTACELRNKKQ
jgi:hypothetical protein